MTEFLNYKVDLFLKNGSKSTGTISHVAPHAITLLDNSLATNISSSDILDLKVVQLPSKKSRQGGGPAQGSQQQGAVQNSLPVDDAIVFAKAPKVGQNDPDWKSNNSSSIKSSGDFDFAANLAMFDKKSVFKSFQQNDTVSPNERLVGHNKKKEKYDNDEMVISNTSDNWDSIGSVKQNSSATTNAATAVAARSEIEKAATPPVLKDKLKLVDSFNQQITLASPVQLLEIERLSTDAFGISAAIMIENCASNLSQLITTQILGGSSRLSNKKNHNLPPLVVVLIGSSRCGARAFATGRHLANHGIRVLAFMLNENADEDLTTQMRLFQKSGGKLVTSNFSQLLQIINHELDTPVELIIDALQGYDEHLDDLFYTEQDSILLKDVIQWCNNNQHSKVLSLDIPSGIDGGSGTTSTSSAATHSPASLKVESRWCVSMGLPIIGILHAYKNGLMELGETMHYLIDIGIPNKVYGMKGNLRKFEGFWFAAEGCIKMDILE